MRREKTGKCTGMFEAMKEKMCRVEVVTAAAAPVGRRWG
jgi:hypothetical protein